VSVQRVCRLTGSLIRGRREWLHYPREAGISYVRAENSISSPSFRVCLLFMPIVSYSCDHYASVVTPRDTAAILRN
jgi:hypothetical protein